MNANELVRMLSDSEFLQRHEDNSLEKLVEKHPYFFIAHALLAKKNSLEQKHSKQSLYAAALLAGNREMLYHFMKEELVAKKSFEKSKEEVVVHSK